MAYFTHRLEFRLTAGAWTDVTADVRPPVSVEYGIFGNGPTDRVAEPGTLTFTLDNSPLNSGALQGYYSPWHTNKRTGFDLDLIVRYSLSRDGGSTWYVHFLGRIVDIVPVPGVNGSQAVLCVAKDPLEGFAERMVPPTLTVQTDVGADELFTTLVADMDDPLNDNGFYAVITDELFTNFTDMAVAWDSVHDEKTTARQELHRIAMSEFGRIVFAPSWGNQLFGPSIVFVSRDYDEGHPEIVATFNDTMQGVEVTGMRDKIVDRVQITTHPVDIEVGQVIWSLPQSSEPPLVQPGATLTVRAPYHDPANGRERIGALNQDTPVATTNYLMNSAADGSGSNLTANFSVVANFTGNTAEIGIVNNGTTAGYITKLELTGDGVYRREWLSDLTQSSDYGSRVVRWDMPYQSNPGVAEIVGRDYLDMHQSTGSQNAERVRFCGNVSDTFADYLLETELLDRIALTESVTGLDHEAIVKGIRLDVQAGGIVWCTWDLEAVPMAVFVHPTFNAADFTANGAMTWTVASGDVGDYSYSLKGKEMTVKWYLNTTTVGGTPNNELRIAIPASRVAASPAANVHYYVDNGTRGTGLAQVATAGTTIALFILAATNWAAATNTTYTFGQITFEIQ